MLDYFDRCHVTDRGWLIDDLLITSDKLAARSSSTLYNSSVSDRVTLLVECTLLGDNTNLEPSHDGQATGQPLLLILWRPGHNWRLLTSPLWQPVTEGRYGLCYVSAKPPTNRRRHDAFCCVRCSDEAPLSCHGPESLRYYGLCMTFEKSLTKSARNRTSHRDRC